MRRKIDPNIKHRLNKLYPGWGFWDDYKKKALKDVSVKKYYDEFEPEFALKAMLIEARAKNKITQKQLAEKLGTKQSAIARFESGKTNPTFDFINKLAIALGAKLKIVVE